MKKGMTIFCSVIILSMLLVACNTDTKEVPETSAPIPDQQPNTTNTEEKYDDSQTTTAQQPTSTPEDTQPEVSPDETTNSTITYTSNGQKVEQEVQTSSSEQSGYSIQHLDSYALVAEEPGKDSLYFKEDDALSMGIEVVNKTEASFEDVKTSAMDTIAAIAPEGKYNELDLTKTLKNQKGILHSVGYETILEADKVTIVVFEHESKLIKLTIYDTPEADLTDAFLQMGLTIH
ncbi:chemotaxis protein [Solibacillus sp. R5-41]|uniref:chemotaxis protein n=1 Tax=Solibacillus sp. R5-41 TaxID=2048654 RepID=UPI000C127F80|nr:chemotaxis protein [Solibacillus sp. R5-41]ATP39164.1 chemotaxis protein [Solibacillus sp. R5-41]